MCNQKAQGWQEARKFLQQRGRTRNTQQERDKAMLYQKKKIKKKHAGPPEKQHEKQNSPRVKERIGLTAKALSDKSRDTRFEEFRHLQNHLLHAG